jgi:hypothetical protein
MGAITAVPGVGRGQEAVQRPGNIEPIPQTYVDDEL